MAETKSIRLDEDRIEFLGRYRAPFSGQVREDLLTLESLIVAGVREIDGLLTVPEACLIVDVCNGWAYSPETTGSSREMLHHEVTDGIGLNALDKKWDVAGPALLEKIEGLSQVGALAVIHLARKFWADNRGLATDALIAELFPVAK